jgi:hypothetical protein
MGWNYGYDAGRAVEQALDKMADNARELGLDYEPCCKDQTCPKCKPAPVQPVAHIVGEIDHTGKVWKPAQPAVPDAFGTREGEHPQYIEGWNDCRQAMLEMKP